MEGKNFVFLGKRQGFMVEGNLMLPTLKSGDAALINPNAKFETGDIVPAKHSFKRSVKFRSESAK